MTRSFHSALPVFLACLLAALLTGCGRAPSAEEPASPTTYVVVFENGPPQRRSWSRLSRDLEQLESFLEDGDAPPSRVILVYD